MGTKQTWRYSYRNRISKADRRALFLACGGKCYYCGAYTPDWTLDHKTPISRGGAHNNSDNWAVACFACNNEKGSRTEEEYRAWKKTEGRTT